MTTLHERAYAKLNLTLDVLGKRPDGYHDLKSVMQTVSICDDITLCLGTGADWKLECDGANLPTDGKNLAWKAAEVYFSAMGMDPEGLTIRIVKRIPSEAGMGGGSADAAAVLRALNRHCGAPLSPFALAELGAKVGSDVPFCVLGGTAMAEGRGERLRVLPSLPECVIVVCKPAFSVSTPALFRRLDSVAVAAHPDNDAMEQAISKGDVPEIARLLQNVFDPVVSGEHSEIEEIKAVFKSHGALGVQMTGSGSAVFGILPDASRGEAACRALGALCPRVFLAKPVNGV